METIIQAINKAMLKGVFDLDEAAVILRALDELNLELNPTAINPSPKTKK